MHHLPSALPPAGFFSAGSVRGTISITDLYIFNTFQSPVLHAVLAACPWFVCKGLDTPPPDRKFAERAALLTKPPHVSHEGSYNSYRDRDRDILIASHFLMRNVGHAMRPSGR
jgi:hypothetical protein